MPPDNDGCGASGCHELGHLCLMRALLCVNYVISAFGGVEFAAMNLASGLITARGHEVHFLAADRSKGAIGAWQRLRFRSRGARQLFLARATIEIFHGFTLSARSEVSFKSSFGNTQEIAHPANEKLFAEVLGQIRPDIIILHNITAVGMNIWRTIRSSGIPCIQVIHDLSLICLNMARFRGGRRCTRLCTACRIQKSFRFSMIANAPNFAFVSPSHATLGEIERFATIVGMAPGSHRQPECTFMVKSSERAGGTASAFAAIGRLDAIEGRGR